MTLCEVLSDNQREMTFRRNFLIAIKIESRRHLIPRYQGGSGKLVISSKHGQLSDIAENKKSITQYSYSMLGTTDNIHVHSTGEGMAFRISKRTSEQSLYDDQFRPNSNPERRS